MKPKPNTICKNPNCKKGEDGGRAHYYTCRTCIKTANWRTVACSPECFAEYLEFINKREAKLNKEDLMLPDRTDMSKEEVKDIKENMSDEEALNLTKEELKDYKEELDLGGVGRAVDAANNDIKKEQKTKKRRKTTRKKKVNDTDESFSDGSKYETNGH